MTLVTITRNGKEYTGHYSISNGMITVIYMSQKKTTQVGGTDPEVLAKHLMSEILLV